MTKTEFILELSHRLVSLPRQEIAERVSFYTEMIDEYMEDGLSEAEAVQRIGDPAEIVAQILGDAVPMLLTEKTPEQGKRKKPWMKVLLIAGAAVLFPLYVSIWALVLSLWAVFVSFAACGFGCLIAGVVWIGCKNLPAGIAMVGAALIFAGFAVLMFFGSVAAGRGTVLLAKKFCARIRRLCNDE